MAVVYTKDPVALRSEILNKTKELHGVYTEEITMSVGFAAHKEKPDAGVDDLEHIADAEMYTQKEKFYKERGIERRRLHTSSTATVPSSRIDIQFPLPI